MYCKPQNKTVCTQSLSSKSCSHLPEELILEILLRLPVRSLLQFKCICKSWKTLISDPRFVKRHLQISTAEPSLIHQRLLFYYSGRSYKMLYCPLERLFQNLLPPVSFNKVKERYWIIGSCNGLLCHYDGHHRVRLWNPSIRVKSNKSLEAFSIDWRIVQYGFGYDQVYDKYKVLVVARNKNDPSQFLTKIYNFGEDFWKTIPNISFSRIMPFSLLGKFVSGTLNWVVEKRDVSFNQYAILSFDLEKETCNEMLLPQDDGDKPNEHILYVLRNSLGVCYETNQTHWVVWLMKEYGVYESWTKFMIIPLDKFNKQPPFVIPLFISENGLVLLVDRYTSQFILYNLNTGQFINSLDDPLKLKSTNTHRFNIHIYCESLVSVP